jgi:dCTP deaminase
MGVLAKHQIIDLVKKGYLLIEPFEEELVEPATYDLRLGSKILASPLGTATLGQVIHLSNSNPKYEIQSGQMVGVISQARLAFPLDICGRFGIKSSFARKGINAFGGLQLDPGFRGKLILSLLNVGPEPVSITDEEPLFSVEFNRLEEPAREEYLGPYQDQDDFPSDQVEYILSARTTSLAEIPALRRDISRLSVLIDELTEQLTDPDQNLDVRPEILERLTRSVGKPRDSLISLQQLRRNITP